MSTVSSVSSSGVDITQFLQKLAAEKAGGTTSKAFKKMDGSPPDGFEDKFGDALKAAGVSDDDAATIQGEVKSAIAAALQNQDGSSDSRDAVRTAIDDTLKKYGVDPEAVREQFQAAGGPGGPGGAGGLPPGGPPPGGAPPGQGGGFSMQATTSTSSDTESDSIASLLQKMLTSDGTTDSSTAQLLQSLLPLVDTTA